MSTPNLAAGIDAKGLEALRDVIRAWEATRSGDTTAREIQRWLIEDMKPSIDRARAYLAALPSTPDKADAAAPAAWRWRWGRIGAGAKWSYLEQPVRAQDFPENGYEVEPLYAAPPVSSLTEEMVDALRGVADEVLDVRSASYLREPVLAKVLAALTTASHPAENTTPDAEGKS